MAKKCFYSTFHDVIKAIIACMYHRYCHTFVLEPNGSHPLVTVPDAQSWSVPMTGFFFALNFLRLPVYTFTMPGSLNAYPGLFRDVGAGSICSIGGQSRRK
jgi:hypothetical protein